MFYSKTLFKASVYDWIIRIDPALTKHFPKDVKDSWMKVVSNYYGEFEEKGAIDVEFNDWIKRFNCYSNFNQKSL